MSKTVVYSEERVTPVDLKTAFGVNLQSILGDNVKISACSRSSGKVSITVDKETEVDPEELKKMIKFENLQDLSPNARVKAKHVKTQLKVEGSPEALAEAKRLGLF